MGSSRRVYSRNNTNSKTTRLRNGMDLIEEGETPAMATSIIYAGHLPNLKGNSRPVYFIEHSLLDYTWADGNGDLRARTRYKQYTNTLSTRGHLLPLLQAAIGGELPQPETHDQPVLEDLILGKHYRLLFKHEDGKAKIVGALKSKPGFVAPDVKADLTVFDVNVDEAIPTDIPEYIQESIQNSPEWKAKKWTPSALPDKGALTAQSGFDKVQEEARLRAAEWQDKNRSELKGKEAAV